jgi:hypothetical protein
LQAKGEFLLRLQGLIGKGVVFILLILPITGTTACPYQRSSMVEILATN